MTNKPSKHLIVPTANLAKLIYRAVRARRVPYNYCVGARDISGGIYIQLAIVDWLRPGHVSINPHART